VTRIPELPDVEGFRRRLARHAGGRIRGVEVLDAGVVRNTSAAGLHRALTGRHLEQPERRGKWLLARTDGPVLLLHFGMTGSLEWNGAPHPHDRVVLQLNDGELRYRDQRKLQGLWLAHDDEEAARITGPVGPDALGLPKAELQNRLASKRTGLKAALMDQATVAGLGNLVNDEVLWRARLHPNRRPGSLSPAEWGRLHRALGSVLRSSVKEGRVPRRRSWLTGVRDDRQPTCPRCRAALRRTKTAGRTTVWCPSCQLPSNGR
jgi:formamidopyrimidine-DNA glycosylase